jgi:hypothetical protein
LNEDPQFITGFSNYTDHDIYTLRGMFAYGDLENRPIKYINVVLWLDANQSLHRIGYPAVEREDGSSEYWIHGIKQS